MLVLDPPLAAFTLRALEGEAKRVEVVLLRLELETEPLLEALLGKALVTREEVEDMEEVRRIGGGGFCPRRREPVREFANPAENDKP